MEVLLALINGIFIGGVFGLFAMGLAIIFGVLGIVNFAHGDFVMLAMVITYLVFTTFQASPYLSLPVATVIVGGLGLIVYHLLFKRLIQSDHMPQLVISLALSLLIQNTILFVMGPDQLAITGAGYQTKYITIGDIYFDKAQAIAFIVAVVITIIMHQFLTRTKYGTAIRASVDDIEVAQMIGIGAKRIYSITFLIGIVLAAIAGVVMETYFPASPTVGTQFIVLAFVAVVLGGLGDTMGAFFGGIIIGVIQQLSTLFMSINLQNSVIFALFVIILIFRPKGLFGRGRVI